MIQGNWRAGVLGASPLSGAVGSPPPAGQSVYDLASLTKVISTSSLLVSDWLASGLRWDAYRAQPLAAVLPELEGTWLESATLGAAWEHRARLIPYMNFCDPPRGSPGFCASRTALWTEVLTQISRSEAGPESQVVYSDLGFLLLGCFLERRAGHDLAVQWDAWKREHGLPALALTYGVRDSDRLSRTRPSEDRIPLGTVNDDRAALLGGIAPHSGLFGDLDEVWAWLQALQNWRLRDGRVNQWLTPLNGHPGPGERFYAGWDRPANSPDSLGGYPSPERALGHTGWTGTAFWWHPPSGRAAVLLTNRTYPVHGPESQEATKKLRRRFFSDFWQGKLSPTWGAST
ncbi:MAG: serine hydrolase [Bdellovibrionales bacterium]|nr:serine hydrolase [Bdellovibrionales bacterium]